jgi:hypothetical protein
MRKEIEECRNRGVVGHNLTVSQSFFLTSTWGMSRPRAATSVAISRGVLIMI